MGKNYSARMMKYRAGLLLVVIFGVHVETQVARAQSVPPPAAHPGWDAQNQGILGRRSEGDLWKAPTATVDPGSLIPDDSTNSRPLLGSFKLTNVFKGGPMENAKPIEMVQPHLEASIYDQPVPAVAPPQHGTHRVAIIALISVALLAFRKFRRPNNGVPPKPNFL